MYAVSDVTQSRMATALMALRTAYVGTAVGLIKASTAAPHPTYYRWPRRSEWNAECPQTRRRLLVVRGAAHRSTSSTEQLCARPSLVVVVWHHRNAAGCLRTDCDHLVVPLRQAHCNVLGDAALRPDACRHSRKPCRLIPPDTLPQPTLPLQLRRCVEFNDPSATPFDLSDPPTPRGEGVRARCPLLMLPVPTPSWPCCVLTPHSSSCRLLAPFTYHRRRSRVRSALHVFPPSGYMGWTILNHITAPCGCPDASVSRGSRTSSTADAHAIPPPASRRCQGSRVSSFRTTPHVQRATTHSHHTHPVWSEVWR